MKKVCVIIATVAVVLLLLLPAASAQSDAVTLAKLVWGEARGEPTIRQAAVVWTVLNRVDSCEFPNTVYEVVTQPYQFTGYSEGNPVDEDIYELVVDVLERWYAEQDGWKCVGRVLPPECVYFVSKGGINVFSHRYPVCLADAWDFGDVEYNPYVDVENWSEQ